ncbi:MULTISPECIES: GH25 family lysozyme [Corynebacterium]|uniref:Lysozyme n=1 Tax=Corynebacterium hadale TaxID=2026255 RepID=A0A269PBU2_9CORY|nr:GH25 family lysozyme [Corynebacterium hadale]PAJ69177.1 hypothetical protein CIG21_08760 [Corynebacterium hadale]WKC60563.1 Lysozyme M1 precursor [Corynebacterium hadale]
MRLGVDCSEYQAGLDFAGFDFAVLRTTDGTYQDPCFEQLLLDAHSSHCSLSTYHYLRSPSEGTTVAEQVGAALDVLGGRRLPMWLDVESPAGLSLADVRAAATAFRAADVPVAGIYTTARYWRRHMCLANPAEFGALWLAQWGDNSVTEPARLGPWPRPLGFPAPQMWQFTSRGRVGGIAVDLNLAVAGCVGVG